MKKTFFSLILLVACISFYACTEEINPTNNSQTTPSLAATKTSSIKIGEPVTFTLPNVSTNSQVAWTVTPSTNSQITNNGNSASVLFKKSGSYTIAAKFGSVSSSRAVSVNDSIYAVTQTSTLANDQISLTVSKSDTAGLQFIKILAKTKNKYNCLNTQLQANLIQKATDFQIEFLGAGVPFGASCVAGSTTVSGSWFILPPNGTSNLKIILNGVTYAGTIVKTGSSFKFTWNYTSGVTLSPLIL